ncbi:hypothetical protein P3L10_015322 [Capsicum annuum]
MDLLSATNNLIPHSPSIWRQPRPYSFKDSRNLCCSSSVNLSLGSVHFSVLENHSRGVAFLEFSEHEHPLVVLAVLNNNPAMCTFGPDHRPRVEFALHNIQTMKLHQKIQQQCEVSFFTTPARRIYVNLDIDYVRSLVQKFTTMSTEVQIIERSNVNNISNEEEMILNPMDIKELFDSEWSPEIQVSANVSLGNLKNSEDELDVTDGGRSRKKRYLITHDE